ncbi:hypothetical protein D1BOALGB6SA_567 [Olavius sp. associated proteobacterium Delta 1]|nr:hypothetical protein D1BOALGB6SA_567 [Olavius sp. associated proteobacterium Delta 1]
MIIWKKIILIILGHRSSRIYVNPDKPYLFVFTMNNRLISGYF